MGISAQGGHSTLLFCTPDYSPPKPPRYSGYHRYQFRLYRQPAQKTIALSPEDKESLGKDPPSRPRGAFPGPRITPHPPAGWGRSLGAKGILTGDVGEVLNPLPGSQKTLGKSLVRAWLAGSEAGREMWAVKFSPLLAHPLLPPSSPEPGELLHQRHLLG